MESINDIIFLTAKKRELYSVVFEVTTLCNWRCKHCYIPEHIDKGLTLRQIKGALDTFRRVGVFDLTLTGGEIFTRNDALDIITLARKMGFNVRIYSNISLVTEVIAKRLSELYISEISCTLFSMDESVHDDITCVEGSYIKTIGNIILLKKYNVPVSVKTIVTRLNPGDWRDVQKFCVDNNIPFRLDHDVFAMKNGNKSPLNYCMTDEQLRMELLDLDKARNLKTINHNSEDYVCQGIQNALFISANGDIYPCVKYLKKVGNIITDDLSYIWENSVELNRIRDMKWKDLDECMKCSYRNSCIHCPGTSLLEFGSDYGPSPTSCNKAKIRKELRETA